MYPNEYQLNELFLISKINKGLGAALKQWHYYYFCGMYSWGNSRRFNSYPEYFKRVIGHRLQKLSLDAGFSCPNRDGSKGSGGCTYCDSKSFNPSYCTSDLSVSNQLQRGVEFHRKRYNKALKYLAYFQAYSNTYADIDKLKLLYEEALAFPDIAGLVIGTRPDCISDEILEYLKKLSEKYYIVLEYGLESCYNSSLERIRRGHTFEESVRAIQRTSEAGILSGAHMIFGLPGESKQMIIAQAETLSELPLHSLKIHQLQIVKSTVMAEEYEANPADFPDFDFLEYIDLVIDFIERLTPDIIIERIAGELPLRFLAGPRWPGNMRNSQVLAFFEQRLKERSTWQGRLYSK